MAKELKKKINNKFPTPSPGKLAGAKILSELGIEFSDGYEYGLLKYIKGKIPSIEEVRKGLSSIKGSLSEEVIREREND